MTGHTNAIVKFETEICRAAIQRPSNTTQYAAGAVAANADDAYLTFQGMTQPGDGNSGSISTARLRSTANQPTKMDCELWIFRDAPAPLADGTAFAPTDVDMSALIAIIPFPETGWRVGAAGVGAAGNAVCDVPVVGHTYRLTTTIAYGMLVVRNTYTPVSDELLSVELVVTLD